MIDDIFNGISNYILFGLVLLIGKIFFKKDTSSYLINLDNRGWKLFGEGALAGFILFLLYPIILLILGIGTFEVSWENLRNTIPVIFSGIFVYIAVALFEETLFRGCIFLDLFRKYSFKIAIIVSSIFFGALHFFSYSATANFWIGLINASIIGVLLCLIVMYTNSLMFPIGYHLAWNLTQSLLLDRQEVFINFQFKESILTGSKYTPEAGLIVTLILVLMYIYINKKFRPAKLEQDK